MVSSRFAASYYRSKFGIDCKCLSCIIDCDSVRARTRDPNYVSFVDPSYKNGAFVFARIANELVRVRPDVPLLVVEGSGTERTLADCGIDLRTYGNVYVMSQTAKPHHYWAVTRICVLPLLCWESQPLVAIEAMVNGVPVIGSDRGGIPETLGEAGIVLAVPSRLTPVTRELPTAMEVEPWAKSIIALWMTADWCARKCDQAVISRAGGVGTLLNCHGRSSLVDCVHRKLMAKCESRQSNCASSR